MGATGYIEPGGQSRMRNARRSNMVSRVVKGGFSSLMAAALLYGGLGVLVQPASASVPPPGGEPDVVYSITTPALSFPVTPVGSSSTIPFTVIANTFVTTTDTTFDPAGIGFYSGTAAPDPTDFTFSGGCTNVDMNEFGNTSCSD